MTSEPPIDLAFLRAQTSGDGRLEADLLALFLQQAEELRSMLDASDSTRTQDLPALFHRIKGSARAIGARPLAMAIERAEAALESPGDARVEAELALDDALAHVCAFAASRLPANRRGGLAKRSESR